MLDTADDQIDPDHDPRRAVVAAVQLSDVADGEFRDSLAELTRLASTLGLTIHGTVTQKRSSFHVGTYLGSGKLDELKVAVASAKAGVVIVDHELSPSQARNLEKETGAQVLDRT